MTLLRLDDKALRNSPVFILGNPRSGTTLFRLLLTSHPKIGIPPESEFIVALFKRYGAVQAFDADTLKKLRSDLAGGIINLAEQWKVDLDSLFANSESFLGLDYAGVCAHIYCKFQIVRGFSEPVIWGDKNNAYGNYIDVLNYLFPSARFIHLVRDGRAVLNSYKKLNVDKAQKHAPILTKEVKIVAHQWADMTDRIDRHLKKFAPDRHVTVRYEDLVRDFDQVTKNLCDFLQIEYNASMRDFDELNRQYELEPREYGWKANTFEPIDPTKCDSWLRELIDDDIRAFETEAANRLARYGYECGFGSQDFGATMFRSRILFKGRIREMLRGTRLKTIQVQKFIGFR